MKTNGVQMWTAAMATVSAGILVYGAVKVRKVIKRVEEQPLVNMFLGK